MRRKTCLRRLIPSLSVLLCLFSLAPVFSVRAVSYRKEGLVPSAELTADSLYRLLPGVTVPFRSELTRGEFCHCLNVYLDEVDRILPQRSERVPQDVDVTADFCRDIEYIVQGGVMGCREDGLFHPEEPLTVAEAELCLKRTELLSRKRENGQPSSSMPSHRACEKGVLEGACMLGHSNALGLYRSEESGMDYFVLNGITAGQYVRSDYLLLPGPRRGSYLSGLEQGSYRYAYIMLGTNDVHRGLSELPVYLDSLREIAENVRRLQPGISLCFLSVTPMGFNEKATPQFHSQEYIRLYNEALKSLSRECGADYIDLFTPLCNRDGYNRTYLARPDGIHYQQPGYDLMLEVLLTCFPKEIVDD